MTNELIDSLWPVVKVASSGSAVRAAGYGTRYRKLAGLLFEVADQGTWLIDGPPGQGDEPLIAQKGRGFVIPAECMHRLRYVGPAASRTRWWVLTAQDRSGRDLLQDLHAPWLLSAVLTRKVIASLSGDGNHRSASILDVIDEQQRRLSALGNLLRASAAVPSVPGMLADRLVGVIRYIDDHLNAPPDRDTLARIAHLSPTRFHYVFTAAIGQSPGRFVQTRRLQRARDLLQQTDLRIKEVASLTGYPDARQFAVAFRRHVGLNPRAYRAELCDDGH